MQYIASYPPTNPSSIIGDGDEEGYEIVEESRGAYVPGGMHPVNVGEIYWEYYQVIRKLGHGRESTVWLVRDLRYSSSNFDIEKSVMSEQLLSKYPPHVW